MFDVHKTRINLLAASSSSVLQWRFWAGAAGGLGHLTFCPAPPQVFPPTTYIIATHSPPPPHLALGGPAPSVLARTATGVLTAAAVNKDDDDEGDDDGDIERV